MLVVNLGRKPTGAQQRLHFDFPVDRLPLRSAAMAKSKIPPLQVNPEAITRLKNVLTDPFYKDAIENSASYNTRVCLERKMRLPFLDAQTGVAQSDCHLWMQKWQRMPGLADGQLYTYPAKRWRKKRRQYLMNDRYLARRIRESDVNEADIHQISVVENAAARLEDGDSTEKMITEDVASKDSWYQEYEDMTDIPPNPDMDDPETDFEDYEELYSARKKKKKTPRTGAKRQRIEYTDAEKPYSCELCGTRYKTRPGLSYHYSHSHNNSLTASSANKDSNKDIGKDKDKDNSKDSNTNSSTSSSNSNSNNPMSNPMISMGGGVNPQLDPDVDDPMGYMTPKSTMNSMMHPQQMGGGGSTMHAVPPPMHHMGGPMAQPLTPINPQPPMLCPPQQQQHPQMAVQNPGSSRSNMVNQSDDPLAGLRKFQDSFLSFLKTPSNGQKSASGKPLATPSPYCDFCLGDNSENKKTKIAEELVSCADCGRSAHPTCLQFTPNMTLSVKKYRWQCIECKSCGLCGTSDNDDQLLFCDDCDRGYHMYCLTPPLSEPPEGSWSCHLCIEEYGSRK